MNVLTLQEFWDLIEDPNDTSYNEAANGLVIRVASRADYILVYRNEELGHPEAGTVQITSYGSEASQLEGVIFGLPPQTMPDIGRRINWRFQLVGVFAPGATGSPESIEADIVRMYAKAPLWGDEGLDEDGNLTCKGEGS